MRGLHELRDEFGRLEGLEPSSRDRGLERLVSLLFRRSHFEVRPNAGAALPRQTDLFAFDDRRQYLVEVKWLDHPATVADLDALWARLIRTHPSVVGVLISLSGVSKTVRQEAAARRERPVLFVGRQEFDRLIDGEHDMRGLLERKLHAITVDGVVEYDDSAAVGRGVSLHQSVRESPPYFVRADGEALDWIASGGSFGMFTFARSVSDPTWGPGPGTAVVVHLPVPVESQADLLAVFGDLDELGFLTNDGQWCIQQTATNWHGLGAASLRSALERWKERYGRCRDLHYREEGCYTDSFGDGFYTLTFDVSADAERRVWHAELSLELPGVPLDQQAVRELRRSVGASRDVYFRARDKPVFAHWPLRPLELRRLTPIAHVVFNERWSGTSEEEHWVGAVVVANPLRQLAEVDVPEDFPRQMRESAVLICDLHDWHSLSDDPRAYRLTTMTWAWTGEGLIVRVGADWDDEEYERGLRARFTARSSTS